MGAPQPSILHVDMDAFYASVEVRDDPALAGKPVCVGGPATGRGVISSASYEARRFGVRSAMPSARALELCPDLVLLRPDFERYTEASRRVMAVFRNYTPLVEPLSLDEAFLDVSGCERLFGDAVEIGRAVKRDILRETGLVASVGVAPTKFIAKLASDLEKPDGFCVIRADEVRSVLDPLPVSKIFGVGPRTAKRLDSLGVRTIGELARLERGQVALRFGATGAWIHDLAHGIDARRVNPRREEKSHGMERTFPDDIVDREELRLLLFEFCEEVAFGLRSRGLRGRTVTVKARFWNFQTVTRTKTLPMATNLGPRVFGAARELLERVPQGPLRLIGVQVSALEDVREPQQGQLFVAESQAQAHEPRAGAAAAAPARRGKPHDRLAAATPGLDRLRRKYGARAVLPASLVHRPPASGADGQPARAPKRPKRVD